MKLKKRLSHLLINIGTSGKYRGKKTFSMSDYIARYVLMNFIIFLGSIILVSYAAYNIVREMYVVAGFCIAMGLISLGAFLLARTKAAQIIPSLIILIFYGLFCVWIIWIKQSQGVNFLFIYVYPLIAIMLLGMRHGIILSVLLFVLVCIEMFIPGLTQYNYHIKVSTRMLASYLLVFSTMIVIEITRKTKDKLIESQNQRLLELKKEAEKANRTKSNFLASMSHEIRTPMNAITGMAELMLREDLSDEARSYAQDIKQAGSNLISIINDILDFSKIESGKLEIISIKYQLSSLINDTVNIIRMRLGEKPIRFFTNIDGSIPNNLTGDEVRLRQILLNLLTNAVKYSEKGHIGLYITVQKRENLPNPKIWLKFTVTDTGKGIKPEDQKKLFGDFVQVDTKKNRNIEGTGLGLAITKRLCAALGGNLSVESEYTKGSAFTVIIPQGIDSNDPFAAVDDPEQKEVLIYERRAVYAKSISWSLNNMNVPHVIVSNLNDFAEALFAKEWFFVFSSYGLYGRVRSVMDRTESSFPGGKKPKLALMVEWGNEVHIPHVNFVSLPVQSLSIAHTLNGKPGRLNLFKDSGTRSSVRFTIPDARLLVVDDMPTNLKVATGLLAPYHAIVDTCLSGIEAIEMIKWWKYDIIFMDHMMPEMDGVETTLAIREWEEGQTPGRKNAVHHQETSDDEQDYGIPIIALTANAVSGVKEMFIENGFSDFLDKPIDITKLDEILDRWIPKEKRKSKMENNYPGPSPETTSPVSQSQFPGISGVDVQRGIAMTGGTTATYRKVLSMFCKDVKERLQLLKFILFESISKNKIPEKHLPSLITQVHALKSASASLGAAEISVEAGRLENAGKTVDLNYIWENLNGFIEHLSELIENINIALELLSKETGEESGSAEPPKDGFLLYLPLFQELALAIKSQKIQDIDRYLNELNEKQLDSKTREILEQISDQVLMVEFEGAVKSIDTLILENSNKE